MIRPKGLGRGLDALLAGPDETAAPQARALQTLVGRSPASRQVPAAHAHGRGVARRARGVDPRAGRDAADPRAPGRRRPLRDHRRRAPLARGAARGAAPDAGAGEERPRSGGARDGADREHPARGPESARGGAGLAAPDRRVRADARRRGQGGRPLAQRGDEPAAPARAREARCRNTCSTASSTWGMRARCSRCLRRSRRAPPRASSTRRLSVRDTERLVHAPAESGATRGAAQARGPVRSRTPRASRTSSRTRSARRSHIEPGRKGAGTHRHPLFEPRAARRNRSPKDCADRRRERKRRPSPAPPVPRAASALSRAASASSPRRTLRTCPAPRC